MAKAKEKFWTVTLEPPAGVKAPKLEIRAGDTGSQRTVLRNYHVAATTRAEAQSVIEEQERRMAEQQGTEAWVVTAVTAS